MTTPLTTTKPWTELEKQQARRIEELSVALDETESERLAAREDWERMKRELEAMKGELQEANFLCNMNAKSAQNNLAQLAAATERANELTAECEQWQRQCAIMATHITGTESDRDAARREVAEMRTLLQALADAAEDCVSSDPDMMSHVSTEATFEAVLAKARAALSGLERGKDGTR